MESPRKIAVLGAGFWSQFQIPAWLELSDVECAALCDINGSKAKALADRFGVPKYFDDPEELIRSVRPDILDVITSPETHRDMVALAAKHQRSGDLPEAPRQRSENGQGNGRYLP